MVASTLLITPAGRHELSPNALAKVSGTICARPVHGIGSATDFTEQIGVERRE